MSSVLQGFLRPAAAGAPSLPTANLTGHFDASDTGNIWKFYQAGTPYHNGVPVDADLVEMWEDDDGKDLTLYGVGTAPTWRSTTPLMSLPCLDFDGTDDSCRFLVKSTVAPKTFSSLITASAFTILISFRVDAINTTTSVITSNDALIAESAGYFGIHLRDDSGTYKVRVYNYDGTEDIINLTISLSTNYVLMVRHESGTLYASLDGGSESSVASGDTQVTSGELVAGYSAFASAHYFDGRMGEIAIYNVALSGSNLSDAIGYFTNKW